MFLPDITETVNGALKTSYLPTCLPACLPAYLPACLYLPTIVLCTYLQMNCVSPRCNRNGELGVKNQLPTYLLTYLYTYQLAYQPTYQPMYLPA